MSDQIGRNDPCPCGSGKKYKSCCMQKKGNAAPASLSTRKFTAKVLNPVKVEEQPRVIDYNMLMDRAFGPLLHQYEDHPPLPDDPAQYLTQVTDS